MLATLYDLEIVEDPAVRDWLDPPSENRHQFLKQAKAVFAVKDNVEAKKQVLCVLVYVHIPCLYVSFGAVCRAALVFSRAPCSMLFALARKSQQRFGKTESQSCS